MDIIKYIAPEEEFSESPMTDIIVKRVISQSSGDSIEMNILCTVIILLLIEEGFLLIDQESEVIDIQQFDLEQLKKWQSSEGTFQLNLVMSGFNDIPLKLLISPLGKAVLLNLVIQELDAETYTTCLTLGSYVYPTPQSSTSPTVYNISKYQLCNILKDRLTCAVKSRIISLHGTASASLIGLPEEVLINIVMKLPISGVINVIKTCKILHDAINKEIVWRALVKRDFGIDQCDTDSWKTTYKNKYAESEEEKLHQIRIMRAGSMHEYMDFSDFMSYIDNPLDIIYHFD
ncbi:uncharacterized protein LOC114353168 [Ostrinia furnacalis]|uniref:uncharacterized protein LOC114353168 n=1 Tax=Ostrinia furnacalis TaxID=93504 RepID=UPI00103D843C|nr:uncharacterized protein LOC114353168 [Ostrinia furnacalis]